MKINPNTITTAQQTYSGTNTQSKQNDIKTSQENNEAISLNIKSSGQSLSSEDASAIKERIAQISEQLSVNYSDEVKDFSKNNVNFFEGSLLTAQSSNIKDTVTELLSE